MNAKLLSRGSHIITKEELRNVAAPNPTKSWLPIPHIELLETIEESLKNKSIEVSREQLAIQRNGMFFFGVLDLKSTRDGNEYCSSLGLRSSNNKIIAIQIAVGARVFVCDNLCFYGDLIALKRKHTSGLMLRQEIDIAMEKFSEKFEILSIEIQKMKEKSLSLSAAKEIIFDLFIDRKIMPLRLMENVARQFINPDFEDFKKPTLWALQNAFTYAAKELSEERKFLALRDLGKFFSQTVQ